MVKDYEEINLTQVGVSKEDRDKHYKIKMDNVTKTYTITHLDTNITLKFTQIEEHKIEEVEPNLVNLYHDGPDVVLIDEKPYYNSREKRFFHSGEDLKDFLFDICKNEQDYKITQQDRLVYENINQTKMINVGMFISNI